MRLDPRTKIGEIEYEDTSTPHRGSRSAPSEYRAVSSYLRSYQQDASYTLFQAIGHGVKMTLDASDTGLGKTWVALDVIRRLDRNFGVICPASVVSKWRSTATASPFEIDPEFVVSYESVKMGKTEWASRVNVNRRGQRRTFFQWNTCDDVILVFDEIHVCSGASSINAMLLKSAIENPHVLVMGLSATISDNPLSMRTTGYGLGLHSYRDWWEWCLRNGCIPGPFGGLVFSTGMNEHRPPTKNQERARARLNEIHQRIFPSRGTRIRKSEIADQLPENLIMAEAVDLDLKSKLIQSSLRQLALDEAADLDKATKKEEEVSPLVTDTRDRQRTELGKVSIFIDRVLELLEEGNSVIVFVCYTATIEAILEGLREKENESGWVLISGGMTALRRDFAVKAFQSNTARICICQIDAGAASIDLDDVDGDHPRAVLISPSYSARQLLQALGRAHRTTTKSKVMQWILFGADTVEERACRLVQHKLNNLSLLNDGDLAGVTRII